MVLKPMLLQSDIARACKPHLPTTMGFFHPGTHRGILFTTIGSRNTVPFRIFLMVPFGLSHIFFNPNSFTRASSGVIVAHLIPTFTLCNLLQNEIGIIKLQDVSTYT